MASGNHQGGENSVRQVDGVSDMMPACWFCGGRAQKRNNGLCHHLCLGESCPPAVALMPDTLVPPGMSLMHFNLLSQSWSSEGVSLSKSVNGSFKRNYLGFQQFLSSTASISADFYSQKLWALIFLVLESWAMGPDLGLRHLASEIFLMIFIHMGVGLAHSASPTLLPVLL